MNKIRFGFKGKNQKPLFMIWVEQWCGNEVYNAYVIFNSKNVIGF